MKTGLRPIRSASRANRGMAASATTFARIADPQHRGAGEVPVSRGEGQRPDAEQRADRRHEGGEHDPDHRAPVVPEQDGQGHALALALGHRRLEHRRLVQRPADDHAGRHDDDAQPERHPPAPAQEVLLRQGGERQEDRGRDHHAGLCPAEGEAGEERAAAVRRVLERHRVGAGLLAACREALQQAGDDEQDRRDHPCGGVAGEAADGERRRPHEQDRRDEHALAAEPVADVSQHHGAQRPGHVAHTEGGQGEQRAGGGARRREEHVVEHERGGRAVDEEVVVLQRAADPRGQRGLAWLRGRNGGWDFGGVRHGWLPTWCDVARHPPRGTGGWVMYQLVTYWMVSYTTRRCQPPVRPGRRAPSGTRSRGRRASAGSGRGPRDRADPGRRPRRTCGGWRCGTRRTH